MLGQSGILTVLGMGIVFTFLIVLVFVISLIGKLINTKISDPNVIASGIPASQTSQEKGTENNPEIAAAITAAVNEYRKSH
jgi:oxaloacetate decarboxylase gamma subunit